MPQLIHFPIFPWEEQNTFFLGGNGQSYTVGSLQGMPKVLKPILKCAKRFYALTCLFVFICMWKALAQRDKAMRQSVQIIQLDMYKKRLICALGLNAV